MTTRRVDISSGASVLDAQFVLLNEAGRRPVVVLFPDRHGVRLAFEAFAASIAARGYAVLLPNICYRGAHPHVVAEEGPHDYDSKAPLQGCGTFLTPNAQPADLAALVAALDCYPEADTTRIGVVGYCVAGGLALRLAAQFPDRVRVAASFYGVNLASADDPTSPHLLAPMIQARVHIGIADLDVTAPPEQIARLTKSFAESGIDFTAELYAGARHGFAIRDSPTYEAKAAERHRKRLLTLFEETLL